MEGYKVSFILIVAILALFSKVGFSADYESKAAETEEHSPSKLKNNVDELEPVSTSALTQGIYI